MSKIEESAVGFSASFTVICAPTASRARAIFGSGISGSVI